MTVPEIIDHYLKRFPSETARLEQCADFVAQTRTPNLFNRKNFAGHITASALIVDRRPHRPSPELLLIHHKEYDRWLQPGGHAEPIDSSPLDAAIREAWEETNIAAADLTLVSPIPLDIHTHGVSPCPAKQEEVHVQHDFRYLFLYSGSGALNADLAETNGLKWVPLKQLENEPRFARLVKKIETALALNPSLQEVAQDLTRAVGNPAQNLPRQPIEGRDR